MTWKSVDSNNWHTPQNFHAAQPQKISCVYQFEESDALGRMLFIDPYSGSRGFTCFWYIISMGDENFHLVENLVIANFTFWTIHIPNNLARVWCTPDKSAAMRCICSLYQFNFSISRWYIREDIIHQTIKSPMQNIGYRKL